MIDSFAREITYARVSLTDVCNLRCRYCMPLDHACEHRNALNDDELELLIRGLAAAGVRKVRFTGGEPTVRPGALDLIERLCRIPGIDTWALTTNAHTLARDAKRLRRAGVGYINISLDTLDEKDYHTLTGGRLADALAGLNAALDAGFERIKINAVLIRGMSERQIPQLIEWAHTRPVDVRFIELMPTGSCSEWAQTHFLPACAVHNILPGLVPDPAESHAPADYFKLPGFTGRIGLITPMSCHFCASCNRIRITYDGHLRTCLHCDNEVDLRPLLADSSALRAQIVQAISSKPARHYLSEGQFIKQSMSEIGG